MVLRDQTKILYQKAERKNKNSRQPKTSDINLLDVTRQCSIGVNDDVARPLAESPIDSAVCIFFNNFVLIPRHADGERGYLECLLPLYTSAPHDSLLSLATSSVALAISGGAPRRREDYKLSRVVFGQALRMAASVIQKPDESVKDETLLAVLLLGFYEVDRCLETQVRDEC